MLKCSSDTVSILNVGNIERDKEKREVDLSPCLAFSAETTDEAKTVNTAMPKRRQKVFSIGSNTVAFISE